ncbi:hypothetical protein [Streptomyces hokutonensis]|uniref:hypothetical protein n=1 Tax=Streptomyces hokutonensis TaxID=1306990 RepID=UPI0036B0393F
MNVPPGVTAGIAVYDRRTGTFTEQSNAHTQLRSASVVKLLIALDHRWDRGPGYGLPSDDRARLDSNGREGRLAGDFPAKTPFYVSLEEAQLLRRVRHEEILGPLLVRNLVVGGLLRQTEDLRFSASEVPRHRVRICGLFVVDS